MTRLAASLLITLFASGAIAAQGRPAQQSPADPLRLTAFPKGQFTLRQGRVQASVNLNDQIAGCTTGTYDGSDPTSLPSGGQADTRVIDELNKDGFWYLVFQTALASNCNVNGQCGACSSITVVWLKLNPSLKVVRREVGVVQEGRNELSLTGWLGQSAQDAQWDNNGESPRLRLLGGRLEVYSEQPVDEGKVNRVSVLRYDHLRPELGLVTSTKEFGRSR